jgi:hypothetical protein
LRRTKFQFSISLAWARLAPIVCLAMIFVCVSGQGATLDVIGVSLLRAVTNLDGSTVRVAQPEAGAPAWQVNPAAVSQPGSLFLYRSAAGTTNSFPNELGTESGHANLVGAALYGRPDGVATNVAQVINFDADYFINSIVVPRAAIGAPLINQSFIFGGSSVSTQQQIDSAYDNYSARSNVLFISAVGNGGSVSPPGTSYNGIGVAAHGGGSSVGPTLDNGRAKPDLTAPADVTSVSTPLVTGAAALLLQAGVRGDGGSDTNAATDIRTLKALLLNGAVKPADWACPAPSPLDPRYGTGVLHVFNSWVQLTRGKHAPIAVTSVTTGAAHPPTGDAGNVSALSGWDLNTCTSTLTQDGVNHYFFHITNAAGSATFTATITLAWNRPANSSGINDLDLYLYDVGTGALMAASTSAVDNVEHLFLRNLPAGRYDLQVFKNGGFTKRITNGETYALAFEFFSHRLEIERAGGSTTLKWPIYPAGFTVEAAGSVAPPIAWGAVSGNPVVDQQQFQLPVNAAGAPQFFRLRRP